MKRKRKNRNRAAVKPISKEQKAPEIAPELRTERWFETLFEEDGGGWYEKSTTFIAEEWKNRCFLLFYEMRVHGSHGTDSDEYRTYSDDMTLREGLEKYGAQLSEEGRARLEQVADLAPPVRKPEPKPQLTPEEQQRRKEAFDLSRLFTDKVSDALWQDTYFHEDSGWNEDSQTFIAEENHNRCYVRIYEYQVHNSHGTDADWSLRYGREMSLRQGLEKYGERLTPAYAASLRAACGAIDAVEAAGRECLTVFFPEWSFQRLVYVSPRSSVFQIKHPKRGDYVLKVSTTPRSQRREAEKLRTVLNNPMCLMPLIDWECVDPATGDDVYLLTTIPFAEARVERCEENRTPDQQIQPIYRLVSCASGEVRESNFRLDERHLSFLGLKIACGIRELHELGFAHLDVKPENIFLLPGDEATRWVLGDLDSARELQYADTGRKSMTRMFLPPEGVGDPCAADLYAWGVTMMLLYRKCSMPGDVESLRQWIEREVRADPESSHHFLRVVLRAVDPDPARRFQSARELIKALKTRNYF